MPKTRSTAMKIASVSVKACRVRMARQCSRTREHNRTRGRTRSRRTCDRKRNRDTREDARFRHFVRSDQLPLKAGWQANIASVEKSMLQRALHQAGGNKSRAAELLGIHWRLLYEKMPAHRIE